MAKICPTCNAENRDEAQFCRACGTSLAAAEAPADEPGITCFECGYANKPGVRYCAKCGVNLMGSVVVPRSRVQAAAAAPASGYPPSFDPLPVPDVPDPEAAIDFELEQAPIVPPAAIGFGAPPPPPKASRTALWSGLGIAAVVAAGIAWWFLNTAPGAPPPTVAQPAAAPAAVPEPAAPPKPAEVAPPTATVTPPPVEATASAAIPVAPAAPATEAPPPTPTTEAAPPLPDAQRLAAEKAAREKAARDKAERDAKAKAASEQREQAAARLKAEQEAAKKRAEEQQRARPAPQTAPPPPVTARPAPAAPARGVAEICGGRNPISQAICESRECASAEHANEPLCQRVRAAEERRRQRQD